METERTKRTRLLSVRLTPQEYADLEARAHAAATEISALVRKVLLEVAVPQRAKHRSPDIAALGRAIVALNRVGSNINQIAKAANQSGDLFAYRAAEEDRASLAEAVRAAMAALGAE